MSFIVYVTTTNSCKQKLQKILTLFEFIMLAIDWRKSCDHILEAGNVKADNLKYPSQLVLVGWMQVTGVMGYCRA